jgi:hypothetical protein
VKAVIKTDTVKSLIFLRFATDAGEILARFKPHHSSFLFDADDYLKRSRTKDQALLCVALCE